MKKYGWICAVLLCSFCCAEDLIRERENVRRQIALSNEKAVATQEKLKIVKQQIVTQKNVIRTKELILAGKDPRIVAQETAQKRNSGKVIWDFKLKEKKELFRNNPLPAGVSYVPDDGRKVLCVINNAQRATAVRYFSKEELEEMKGKKIRLVTMVKGAEIKGRGAAKFMLMVTRQNKKVSWPDANLGKGSFDWKKAEFTYNIPFDAVSCALILGLQDVTGTIRYKDLKVTVME